MFIAVAPKCQSRATKNTNGASPEPPTESGNSDSYILPFVDILTVQKQKNHDRIDNTFLLFYRLSTEYKNMQKTF